MAIGITNWAGNYAYRATTLHQPATIDELQSIVARAPKIRALGSRHCFNDVADSAELVTLDGIEQAIEVDPEASTVTVGGGIKYGDLARALEREGFALHNMASLPHISVAGAVSTATHGSGDKSGNLSTAVSGIELVTAGGDVLRVARGDADFAGMVVNIGTLGVVTRLTLDVQPHYLMRQQVFERFAWDVLFERFDDVMSDSDSVSLFTDYGDTVNEVWLKSRIDPDQPRPLLDDYFGAPAATRNMHPIPRLSAENCTEQMGVPGSWKDRLPHFRMDAVPASGDEIQTEYMVSRTVAVDALRAVLALAPTFRSHLWTTEVRTAAADDLWLSTSYGRDTVCIHFSWKNDLGAVERILPELEAVLAPFDPRPHWGKLFLYTARDIDPRFERLSDFRRLTDHLDPRGKFRNAFIDRHMLG